MSETSLDKDGHPTNDDAGNATFVAEYDQQGNLSSDKALDAKGNPTLWDKEGYASRKMSYDPWGNLTEESYFDVDGTPVASPEDGVHTVRVAYDDHGNRTDIAYFDLYGNPVDKLSSPSYQRVHMEYDKQNHVIRETFFNNSGQPTKGDRNAFEIQLGYDAKSNTSEISFFDEKGKPMNGDSGVHLMRWEYDDSGRLIKESYFGTDSKPASTTDGYHTVTLHYDSNGRRDRLSYSDIAGGPPKQLGYSQVEVTYDRWGNTTEWQYARTRTSSLTYDRIRATYNDSAGPIETCYFNSDNTKAATSDGVSCITTKYDERGLKIQEEHLDRNGKLKANAGGIARSEYSYNDKRQTTKEEYFGVNGPTDRLSGQPYLIETEYDAAGHKTREESVYVSGETKIDQYDVHGGMTEESYRNPQGRLMTKKGDTYALIRYERTDQGRKLVTRYLGADEKPVVAKGGCATERDDLDARGKAIKEACFDVNDRPMESTSTLGVAVLTYTYDANENVTEIRGFGADEKPALTTRGYTRASWQYDAAGNKVRVQMWTQTDECIVRQFDTKGNVTEESYYDAQGKPEVAKGDTYATVRYERTDDGKEIVTRYLSPDGKPVVPKDGCAIENQNLDASGQLLKDACLDANGRPMMAKSNLGAAVLTWVRDAKEKITQSAGFGPDGKPVETMAGYARFVSVEDSSGNPTEYDYFDRDGVLILRITAEKLCSWSANSQSISKADCIISEASRTFLRSGQKKYVLVVSSVSTDDKDKGTALTAQLHVGDVLLENDGINSFENLWERFTSGPDHARTLVFLRNGKQMSVQIPKGALGATVGLMMSSE